ncbi:MAG: TMEM175 family protein [Ginsengibacter sp.]
MFRKAIAKNIEKRNHTFRLRGHEVLRIEAFSDAVFAFAVTLLIVSLEVPKSFEELMTTMRGFFAFGISFLFLMMIWYDQNLFFRRYGMHDILTVVLNCTLIFLVLFFVYPLKFLFTLLFSGFIYGPGHSPFIIQLNDVPKLLMIYGMGYVLIQLLFFFMYMHAFRKRRFLELTQLEIFDTKTFMYAKLIIIAIGLLSVFMAKVLPINVAGNAGLIYILIGPAFSMFHTYRARKKRKMIDTFHLS